MGLLQAIVEKPKLIKDFSVNWDVTNHEVVDLAIVPMLQTDSWIGGLRFCCRGPVEFPGMDTFFRALKDNTSLRSLEFEGFTSLSKEALGNLWGALQYNATLERLRFVNVGASTSTIYLPADWERDFVSSVLPCLSLTELKLPAMRFSEFETFLELWKSLAVHKRLNSLSIADLAWQFGWENLCAATLPFLTLYGTLISQTLTREL
jgi:hypothetical protein